MADGTEAYFGRWLPNASASEVTGADEEYKGLGIPYELDMLEHKSASLILLETEPLTLISMGTDPIAEEIVGDPIAEEIVGDPIAEEIIGDPIAEEIVGDPIAEEIVGDPIAEEKDLSRLGDSIELGDPIESNDLCSISMASVLFDLNSAKSELISGESVIGSGFSGIMFILDRMVFVSLVIR